MNRTQVLMLRLLRNALSDSKLNDSSSKKPSLLETANQDDEKRLNSSSTSRSSLPSSNHNADERGFFAQFERTTRD